MRRRLARIILASLVMPQIAYANATSVCDVVFTAESGSRVSGLVYEVGYADAGGAPLGGGEEVACKTLLPEGLGKYNDDEASATLNGGILHVQGVEGRFDVTKCRFDASNGFNPDALAITVTDAVNPYGYTISPEVFASDVECGTPGELDGNDGATGGDSNGGGGPSGGCGSSYDVTFHVSGDTLIGALQLAIDYQGASGDFAGSRDQVSCTAGVSGIAIFNDKDSVRTLKAGIVAPTGFHAPADVVTCRFEAVDRAPTASDFSVTVEDAAVPTGQKILPAPNVAVSSIVPVDGLACGGSACGNGVLEDGEECDDGALNGAEASGCSDECELPEACGDGDNSGSITASDARRALNLAVGLPTTCTESVCDVNDSGNVTATDARLILDKSVGRDVALSCSPTLIVSLDDDVELGGIELDIDYSAAGTASFVGEGETVQCVSLLGSGAVTAFNNDTVNKVLHAGLVALPAINGPTPLFACNFHAGFAQAGDVVVNVADAIAPDYVTVSAPNVSVSW